jgi:hypothetical protein
MNQVLQILALLAGPLNGILGLIKGLLGKTGVTVNNPDTQKPPSLEPQLPKYPRLNPQVYLASLEAEVQNSKYNPVEDDPKTAENERQTFCNYFVREVCKWFGWSNFESPDRDQAGEITRYMRSHPQQWQKLAVQDGSPDYNKAAQLASEGCLIVAGQENPTPPPTGHVAVITPQGGTIYSPSWKKTVPFAANVGGKNWCGKPLSQGFKTEPELFLFLGN